jgi:hypothetical protein
MDGRVGACDRAVYAMHVVQRQLASAGRGNVENPHQVASLQPAYRLRTDGSIMESSITDPDDSPRAASHPRSTITSLTGRVG